jgi:hypothetical protein
MSALPVSLAPGRGACGEAGNAAAGTIRHFTSAPFHDAHSDRDIPAPQRAARHSLGGSYGPACRREPLVSRRFGQRARGTHRVRAPVRAHAVSGLCERGRERALRTRATSGWDAQRLDLARSHQLFRDGPIEPARAGAVARSESHGLPAPRDDATEARHSARCGAERTTLVNGQSALRHLVGATPRSGLSRWPPISSFAHRLHD